MPYHNGMYCRKVVPPVGIYEHKFNKKGSVVGQGEDEKPEAKLQGVDQFLATGEPAANTCDMRMISAPHYNPANTQPFSSLAQTQQVDFTKGQTRDEVSFYKDLARTEQAKALGIDIKDYEDLIKMHKSGKYIINFVKAINPQGTESLNCKQDTKTSTRKQGTDADVTMTGGREASM